MTPVEETLTRNITALNEQDVEGFLANQQPDVEFVLPGGVTLHGRDELRAYLEAQWKAFPDGKLTFGVQAIEGDFVATEIVFTGTHQGPMVTPGGTIPPTGRSVTLRSASFLRIKDGLVASETVYLDTVELMRQLDLDGS